MNLPPSKIAEPKVHIELTLAVDVVESLKACGRNYNARAEKALRKAGFSAAPERAVVDLRGGRALLTYLKLIVEPTVEEFIRNPTSIRHAELACIAAYHSVDRVSYPHPGSIVAEAWRKQSTAFALIEIFALDAKHVKSWKNKPQPNTIPISAALYGTGFNTHMLNDTGEVDALRNLAFLVQDAVKFIHSQIKQP
jgi:hypothetical protein